MTGDGDDVVDAAEESGLPQEHALLLAAMSDRMPVGDVTTLANPDVVEQIRVMVQGSAPPTEARS